MSSNLLDTNVFEVTSRLPPLRLVAPIKPTVLIAEDHDDSREMLRILLEMRNCSVTEACDGLEAVALAVRMRPEIILMDGSLPLIDGLEATRRIRKYERLRDVFILAMNGWGTSSYHAAAIAAGSNDCLVKPIDFVRLESFLAPFFHQSSGSARFWAAGR